MSSPVSIIRCADYDRTRIGEAVQRAVDLIGGIDAFIKPGERVLIKPNMLKAGPPERAITTHPEVVRAVIRLVRKAGGTAMIGDSPGMGDLRKVAEQTGILAVVRDEGAVLAEMEEAVDVRNTGQFHHFELARSVRDADAVINLPKFKTHGMMILTGAVKNLFGCIPGRRKVQWHFSTGVSREAFARMLVELCALIKPRLTIMDSVLGMEGNGPGSGDPRQIGLILAAEDPVALDAVCARIAGIDPAMLYVLRAAKDAGYGESGSDRIAVLGEPLDNAMIKNFRLPPGEHLEWKLPEWTRRFLKEALTTRPVIHHESCIHCGICVGHCPQRSIKRTGDHLAIDYRTCIRCFCCQEFCPKGAIAVGKGWALKLIK